MKDKWRNYALKDGKVKESYIREYSNRSKSRKASEASRGNSTQQSRQEQEEVKLVFRDPCSYKVAIDPIVLNDAWVVNLRKTDESSREEEPSETHQEGRQGVQSSDQRRCEAQETNSSKQGQKEMKKETMKERKHEAKETKAYEKKEDKMESKVKKTEKVSTAGRKRG
jgi:hypothetical protein